MCHLFEPTPAPKPVTEPTPLWPRGASERRWQLLCVLSEHALLWPHAELVRIGTAIVVALTISAFLRSSFFHAA